MSTGKRLTGKQCVVTGAAQGIGRAIVEAFLKEGATVVAVDNNASKLAELDGEPGVFTRVLDVRDKSPIQQLARDFPDVNVLVNCVGVGCWGTVVSVAEEQYDDLFRVNVKSMFLLMKEYLPQMIAGGGGSIINISSVVGAVRGFPQHVAYGATKAAIVGLTKGVAIDHASQGIRCNAICPGAINTPAVPRAYSLNTVTKEIVDYVENNFMHRMGEPHEVANLCVYLASDEASYHTGSVFVIDGGQTL